MSPERDLASMEHFVSHYMLRARFSLEDDETGVAETERTGLINRLHEFSKDPVVAECIKLVRSSDWSSYDGIDAFKTGYDKLNHAGQDMSDAVNKLFGQGPTE
ncbi:MAG: hypothetical protein GY861_16200 [bacterium]|nr:hypothetical protein [bacterium]